MFLKFLLLLPVIGVAQSKKDSLSKARANYRLGYISSVVKVEKKAVESIAPLQGGGKEEKKTVVTSPKKVTKSEVKSVIEDYQSSQDSLNNMLISAQKELDLLGKEMLVLRKKAKEKRAEIAEIKKMIFIDKFETYYLLLTKVKGVSKEALLKYKTPTKENFKKLLTIYQASMGGNKKQKNNILIKDKDGSTGGEFGLNR